MSTTLRQVLAERFEIGMELTFYELQESYKRITGFPLPRGCKPQDAARRLAQTRPLAFEFEVNRLRGYAFEHSELPG